MNFAAFVNEKKIVALDGGTGTALIARGLPLGDAPEALNVTNPEIIADIARGYFSAGSDAVFTNTFGGSRLQLMHHGLEAHVYDYNFKGAENALSVRPEGKFVIGSMGPSGEFLAPMGHIGESEMIASFSAQAKALSDAGVHAFAVETFVDIREARCAIQGIREHSTLPIIVSLTYDKTPAGYRTMMGASIADAVEAFSSEDIFALGSNCGHGMRTMIEIMKEYRALSADIRLHAKTNAGLPEYRNGETVYTEDAAFFAECLPEMIALGVTTIGGCCGTNETHVRAIRNAIDAALRAL